MSRTRRRGRLVVLAGPSGVGKSSVVKELRELYPDLWFSVSATTREQRPGEVDGRDYRFVSRAEFDRMIAEAAKATGGGDLKPLDDLLGADLADAWQSFEQRGDLHLAQDLVIVSLGEHVLESRATSLQALLELCPGATGGSRLLQRCGPLLLGQLGKGHDFLRCGVVPVDRCSDVTEVKYVRTTRGPDSALRSLPHRTIDSA